MNYNLMTYAFYIPITLFITVRVGWICYINGKEFTMDLFPNDMDLVEPVNKLLLTGYYLLNIGYALLVVNTWNVVESIPEMIESLASRIGLIMIGLAIMHYINISSLLLFRNWRENKNRNMNRFNTETKID